METQGGNRPMPYAVTMVLIMSATVVWAALALRWRWPPFELTIPAVGWAIFFAYTSIAALIAGILVARYAHLSERVYAFAPWLSIILKELGL